MKVFKTLKDFDVQDAASRVLFMAEAFGLGSGAEGLGSKA